MTDEVYIREPGVEDCEHLEVCEHACRMWCRSYSPRVDRDALLKLADEIDREAMDGKVSTGWTSADIFRHFDYARRIREAIGA